MARLQQGKSSPFAQGSSATLGIELLPPPLQPLKGIQASASQGVEGRDYSPQVSLR